jgi:hypothetical protein
MVSPLYHGAIAKLRLTMPLITRPRENWKKKLNDDRDFW